MKKCENKKLIRRHIRTGPLLVSALLSAPLPVSFAQCDSEMSGIFSRQESLASGLQQVPGPLPSVAAWRAESKPVEWSAEAGFDFAPRGSLSFWFFNEKPYESGPGISRFSESLFEAPGVLEVRLQRSAEAYGIVIRQSGAGANLRLLLPSMPGDSWNHLAVEWDHLCGSFNAWLNGSPIRLPGTRIEPWTVSAPKSRLTLKFGTAAVSDVRVSADTVCADRLAKELTPLHFKKTARLLGDYDPVPLDLTARRGELLHEWTLDNAEQVADWVMEGPGEVSFQNGWMQMESLRPQGPEGHFVFWPQPDLPGGFLAEWEFRLPDPEAPGLAILFFAARGRNGEDLFDPSLAPRNGVFSTYHSGDIDCYHISYYANNPFEPGRITSNLRKNSGFYLVANGPAGIRAEPGQIYRLVLLKEGGTIRFAVNGREIISHTDDGQMRGPVHSPGKIGLRQMETLRAQYRNLGFQRAHIISDGTSIPKKRGPMVVRCVCFNGEIPKDPSTKEARSEMRPIPPGGCICG